ncbi:MULTISPECIES: cyclic nucleotide-binding domain-containing protein [unclassified Paenibacillus]|uniref:cyclic nucleotide-binding domain-containing protein n=1 Tax=unclassified Paenibacillus TaxID=185978 RepID=UPI002F4139C9
MGLQTWFQLRHEDRRKVWMLGSVFFLAGVSEMINYTSFMAIFNSRVGTQYLPLMYFAEAFLLPLEGWLLSYFSQRTAKSKFMVLLYGLFIGIGLLNGAVLLTSKLLGLDITMYYIVLFLSSNFVIRQQTLLMWSTAFDLCPTQQAKRVMPVFVLTAIIGGIAAGVISNSMAAYLGPELLYMLAVLLLLAGLPQFVRSIRQYLLPFTNGQGEEQGGAEQSSLFYLKQTIRSPFLLTVIGIMTLMPAVYFLIEYQYFTVAQASFATEKELTSFYGLMVIILFCAAFLLQIVAARLMDWLGASNTVFAIALIFLASLLLVSTLVASEYALIVVSIGYGLLYLLLYYFAEPSYQFFFKMLPLQQRDGYRYIAQSLAASVGILLGSGLSMLHSSSLLALNWQAVIGLICTLLLVILAWTARHLYLKELIKYLQDSSAFVHDFVDQLLDSIKHERIRKALVLQLQHANANIRQFTLELLGMRPHPALGAPLWQYACQHDGEQKAAALAALHADSWSERTIREMELFTADAHEKVRTAAYRQLLIAARTGTEKKYYLERAYKDDSLLVRMEAWRGMDEGALLYEDMRKLLSGSQQMAVLACQLISERKLKELYMDVMMSALSDIAAVKLASVRTMGKLGGAELVVSFMEMLVGSDKELRSAIEDGLLAIGADALPELLRFIDSPQDDIWTTAVAVMMRLDTEQIHLQAVIASCAKRLAALSAGYRIVKRIAMQNQPEWTGLARARAKEIEGFILDTVWQVMLSIHDERVIAKLRAALESKDEELRDNGLEVLSENLGNARLSGALLGFYRQQADESMQPDDHNGDQSEVTDSWLQAIAIKAGAGDGGELLMNNWEYLSALDKITFLKQVPLFQNISIEELGRIASIAREKVFPDGELLLQQGQQGQLLTIIMSGHVELSGINEAGLEGTISVLGELQTIGETSLFDDQPSSIDAQVIFGEAKVLQIESKEMTKLVRLYPEIGVGLLRAMSMRLRTLEQLFIKLG